MATAAAIIKNIVDTLRSGQAGAMSEQRITVRDRPVADATGIPSYQVVPGTATVLGDLNGFGYAEVTFSVFAWTRLMRDQVDREYYGLAGLESPQQLIQGAFTDLNNVVLDSDSGPIMLTNIQAPSVDPASQMNVCGIDMRLFTLLQWQ